MTDFETHPIGTAKRIEELEAKLAKADVTALLREARAALKGGA